MPKVIAPSPTFSRLFLQVAVLRGYNNICNTPQDDLRERKEGKGGVLFYLLLNYKLQAFFYDKGGDTFFPPRASYVVRILFPGHTKSSTSKFSCNTQSNIRFIEVPVSLCLFWQGSNKIIWHALKNLWVRPAPSLIYNSQVSVSRPDWNLYIRYVFSCPARLSLHFVSIHY